MRLDVPVPKGAEERAWQVTCAAFKQRVPVPRERQLWRPALAIATVAVVAGLAASPPGSAVLGSLREAVGVKSAAHALFSLPAPGRLLVESATGPWIVQADGSKRRLGSWREASWSPFGRFVVVVRANELAALEPDGDVRWSLARKAVRFPRWGGSRTDTRIAYLTTSRLHVVAGDGTGDRAACQDVVAIAPAWQPGSLGVLALAASNGSVSVRDVQDCRLLWRTPPVTGVTKLEWSADGRQLLVLAPYSIRVYDLRGRVVAQDDPSDNTRDVDATFIGRTHAVAVLRNGVDVFLLHTGSNLFHAAGELRQVVSSPDGRWLLLTWPAANEWVFVRVQSPHRIRAVSDITRQFGGSFPRIAGWCCSS